MTLKQNQPMLVKNLDDGFSAQTNAAGTGVALLDQAAVVRHLQLTLTGFVVSIDEADDYGGTKLCDLPDRNLLLLGCEADLVVTKAGTTNGLVAATDINVGIGTAVASNQTLSSTMQDVLEVAALTTDALAVDYEDHSVGNATSVLPIPLADAATNALYLNMAVAAGITASDTASVAGIIDVWYLDLGNRSS